jgi:hypothetical protein
MCGSYEPAPDRPCAWSALCALPLETALPWPPATRAKLRRRRGSAGHQNLNCSKYSIKQIEYCQSRAASSEVRPKCATTTPGLLTSASGQVPPPRRGGFHDDRCNPTELPICCRTDRRQAWARLGPLRPGTDSEILRFSGLAREAPRAELNGPCHGPDRQRERHFLRK